MTVHVVRYLDTRVIETELKLCLDGSRGRAKRINKTSSTLMRVSKIFSWLLSCHRAN